MNNYQIPTYNLEKGVYFVELTNDKRERNIFKVIKDFYSKNYEASDIRQSIVASVSVKVMEPVFESQTKTKLGSQEIEPRGKSMRAFINDFLKDKLDNFLHKNPEVAKTIENKIKQSEKERKELAGIRKIARERSKKANP